MSECRVCFVKNLKMHFIHNTWYQEMYEKLSGTKLNESGRPNTICYFCNSLLQKFSKFFNMSQNAEKILTKRLLGAHMMDESQFKTSIHNLALTSVQSISFIDDGTDEEPEVTVTIKEEPVDFQEMEPLKEEYLDSPAANETVNEDTTMESTSSNGLYLPEDIPIESNTPTIWLNYPNLVFEQNKICFKKEPNIDERNIPDVAKTLKDLNEILERIPIKHAMGNKFILKTAKRDTIYDCRVCNYTCQTAKSLTRHVKVHDLSHSFSCELCLYRFNSEKKLSRHKKFCSVCRICGKKLSNIGRLRTHVRLHTGEQPYSCDICGRGFNQKTNLQTHLRVHTREIQYPCKVCPKTFPFKSFLNRHMLIHSENPLDAESYQRIMNCHKLFTRKKKKSINICTMCGKILQSKESLTLHMRLHTGEQPYSCECCKRVFNQKCNLFTHVERVHAGHELFSCQVCRKMFPFNSELKRHLETHTAGKLNARDFDIFQQKHIYMLHRKLHTGQPTLYPCDMCTTKILSY